MGSSNPDVWSSWTRPFQKKRSPKWSISFHIVLKKWVFRAHRRVPPTTGVVELPCCLIVSKKRFPKWSISFHIALKKWVFQAHRRVPPHDRCRGTTLMSDRFKKKRFPNWSISFHIAFKKWVFQAHRRVPPTTGVVELLKNNLFCNENQWDEVALLEKW